MKKAVIVIGKHGIGKSKTIREFLKPKLGISKNKHIFELKGKKGYILSQSFEETKKTPKKIEEAIKKYCHYEYLVLAGRPIEEKNSHTKETKQLCEQCKYNVLTVEITSSNLGHYEKKANDIFNYLNK